MRISIYILLVIFVILLFPSCQKDFPCGQLLIEKKIAERDEPISIEKIYDGYNMQIENRFEFNCVFFQNKDISDIVNIERKNDDNMFIKLLDSDKISLKNNDTIKTFFVDKRVTVWYMSSIKLVNIIIKKEETPCDSIANIIYKDISGKIQAFLTDKEVERKQLYDYTLKNKIKEFIASLSKSDSIKFNKCKKNYFILDLINSNEEFGFIDNKYYLTPKLKAYLDIMANGIAFEVNQHEWNDFQFIIKCIGYADIREYTGNSKISFSDLGVIDSTSIQISNTNCNADDNFGELEKRILPINELKTVTDNCDLSILRSFASVIYLNNQLKKMTKSKIFFQYKGGGEVPSAAYDINRKIALYIEIKAISEK